MKRILLPLLGIFLLLNATAQLSVQNGFTAQQLGNTLAGPNITVTNPSVSGAAVQYGTFSFLGNGFPLSSGIVLTTGSIFDCPGPNTSSSTSTNNNQGGNTYLTALAGVQTYDAVVLQIDFTVQSDMIEFRYLFASEEYNEYVGSSFNDVFAFYISGPGITGMENLAVVPNTNDPVTINNINLGNYWQYYNDNELGTTNIEFDGFTTVLTAKKSGLIPCSTYTLTMMIADAGDGIFDAAVFLQANSLIQGNVSASTNTFSGNNIALEGCIDASFTFALDSVLPDDTYISYGIGGTAINGVDYQHIDSMIVIPAGQLSATIVIDAISDGLAEGTEDIELYFIPAPCEPMDTVLLQISDYQSLQFSSITNNLSCFESGDGEIDFVITGGTAPFTVILTDTNTQVSDTFNTLPITGLSQGTYHVRILDSYGCYAEDIVAGGLFDADTTFLPDGTGVSYYSSLVISGFTPGQTLTDVNQIVSICANIEHSYSNDLDIQLRAPNMTQVMLKNVGPTGGAINANNFGEPVASGTVDNWATNVVPGVGYDYCWTNNPIYPTMNAMVSGGSLPYYTYVSTFGNTLSDYYLPPGSYATVQPLSGFLGTPLNGTWTLVVTDHYAKDNGYIFNWSISLSADIPDSVITLTQPDEVSVTNSVTNPSCGASNGSIDLTVSNGAPPYTFLWSNGAATEDVSNLSAGNYSVTVSDIDNCDFVHLFSLPNSSAASITQLVTNQVCPGTNTGSINITVSGGTAPYNYLWSTNDTTQDINNLYPGNYSVQITDSAGCISAANFIVSPAVTMTINGMVTNEECGNMEGSIDITVLGGVPPLFYEWSTNLYQEDISDLSQGTYTVTVIDNNDCEATNSFTVANLVGNCIPDCDLVMQHSSVTNEICGNTNGSIQLDIFTTNIPYSVVWNTGSHQEDINGLSAGTYTVTITDNGPCTLVQSFSLINQTGTLALTGTTTSNETCGNGLGGININPNGGALPYSYIWSNGVTTQDLSNLHAGNYTVTVTDANGCNIHNTYTVTNTTTGLAQTYGNAMNAVCGQNNGSIDITIGGGVPPYSYTWSNGSHTQDLTALGPGIYTCTVTDGSGCSLITAAYSIINESGSLAFTYINADNEACGNGGGDIHILVNGGQSPYTYLWSNGAITQNISNLVAGTYSCTVTDITGCSLLTGNIEIINESGTLTLNQITTMNETCSNGLGFIQLTVSGGNTPYSFLWNTGSTSQNLYGLETGSYTCTVSDASGCFFTANAYINNDPGTLQVINMITSDETCGNGSGSIDLITSGGAAPLTYLWSGGYSTQDLSGLHAGNYQVTVSDFAGCQAIENTTIFNNAGNLSAVVNSVTNEICGNGAGAIDIGIIGGTQPYSFSWSNSASSEDISGLSSGIYSCTITDSSGCEVTLTNMSVSNNSGGLSLNAPIISEALCSSLTGAINITPNGGALPLTYLWSNTASTEDISGLTAGIYTVTVTDTNGCTVIGNYTVPYSPGNLSISNISITDEICGNGAGSINISISGGTGPYSYNWSSGPTTQDITSLSSGNFSVTVTDSNSCQVTAINISVQDNPGNFTLTGISVANEVCDANNGAIYVSLSGGSNPITYQWSNGGFTRDQYSLTSGIYTCTTTDQNGCQLIYSATVQNNPGNLAAIGAVTPETCGTLNGAIDLTITGGTAPYSFVWSNGQTTEDLSGIHGGTYIVNVTDSIGCLFTDTYSISSTSPIFISSSLITNETCNDESGSILVNIAGGTGNYTYDWTNLGGSACCNYSLEMRDQMGNGWNGSYIDVYINGSHFNSFSCTGYITNAQIPVCEGDLLQLFYSSGFQDAQNSYSLFDGTGLEIFVDNPPPTAGVSFMDTVHCSSIPAGTNYLSGLASGDYELTVTDLNGCSLTSTLTVGSNNGTIAINTYTVAHDTCGNGVGAIDISMNGGNPPYTYEWNTGSISQDISGLFSDTYSVTITDQNNCEYSDVFIVNQLSGDVVFSAPIITNTYCGDSIGSIDLTVTGGIPPYNFLWSNGATTEDLGPLAAGTYTLTFTDAVGCGDLRTYQILNITNGLGATSVATDEHCGNGTGSIDLTINGGFPPYQINWNTADTTEDLSGLFGGTYVYTVTDSAGCMAAGSIIVLNNNGTIAITGASVTHENCNMDNGAVNISVNGGTPPLTYLWSNGAGAEDISSLDGGISYQVTVTDSNGCVATGNYPVNSLSTFDIIDTLIYPASCAICPNGSIFLTIWGDGGPPSGMTFLWSNGETNEDIASLLPGTYTITATDAYGCIRIESYIVISDSTVSIAESSVTEFNLYPNPTTGSFTLSWPQVETGALNIEVFNAIGDKISGFDIPDGLHQSIRIDLGENSDGIYFVKVSKGSAYQTKRISLLR